MIREAVLADLDEIYALEQGLFTTPWSRVSLEAEFYKDYASIYVCIVKDIIVGYIIVWDLAGEAEIVNIAVLKSFQRQGIGRQLLEYVINSHKVDVWHLEVDCTNIPAMNLYKNFDFKITGKIQDYYGAGKHAFRMLKNSINNKEQKDDT